MSFPHPDLTHRIIGLAINVHRKLGPGLLESVYNACLRWELEHANLSYQREVPLPVVYEDILLPQGYFADLIVENAVLLELKSVEHLLPVHDSQTLTYLHLSPCEVALLLNFNSATMKEGLRRFIRSNRRPVPQISA